MSQKCPKAATEQDAAIFLTAAFTGLRQGELVALRWRDVDFAGSYIRVTASYTNGQLSTPKSGKVRSVSMAAEVGEALARLGQRDRLAGPEDLVSSVCSAVPSTRRRCSAATAQLCALPACGRCASTTCATPSARASSVTRISAACSSGWGTRTCRRRC